MFASHHNHIILEKWCKLKHELGNSKTQIRREVMKNPTKC